MRRGPALALLAAVGLAAAGAAALGRARTRPAPPAAAPPFTDATEASALDFRPGLPTGLLNIREIAGSGCAFLDHDGDGRLDLLLLGWNRTALYRNEDGRRFREVTAEARLPQQGQWIGAAAADYDNDGDVDLFLSGYARAALLRNDGGAFLDVSAEAGLAPTPDGPRFATGGVWGDYDRDGRVDLYVPRYVHFRDGMREHCVSSRGVLETCNPDHYGAERGSLYRNVGGRFRDVTRETGADRVTGKCWGGVFFDPNDDGWPDLYLANDEVPGDLLHNRGGRFENTGKASGVAFDADGRTHAAMGSDVGDYDRDGRLDLVVTAFSNEAFSLYRNNGDGTFTDRSLPTGIGVPTQPMVGWGTRFLDYDRDGWEDLFFINGHATDAASYGGERARMAQPMQLFRSVGGHFEPVAAPGWGAPMLGRGAASGDYDNDGDEDLLVVDLAGKARLLRNDVPASPARQWIGFRLVGSRSNRDAIGARVNVESGATRWVAEVSTGGSLFSAQDPRLLIGLGAARPERVTIRWPSGATARIDRPEPGRYHEIRESSGPAQRGSGSPAAN